MRFRFFPSHNTEESRLHIITFAIYSMSIEGISALDSPVISPELLIICPRLIFICLCRRYAIFSYGSLQKGFK